MKVTFFIPILCLSLLAACRPGATSEKTKEFLLRESEVPAGLPLPTIDWEFDGNKFTDKAALVEEHSTATGQRLVVYGFTTSLGNSTSDAELELFFKGRSGEKDEWIVRWNVDGNGGEKDFTYKPGTEQDLVDAKKLKVTVK